MPNVTPACRPIQNQGRNRAPAIIAAPTVMTAPKPTRPISGLMNPKALACSSPITVPQLMTGLMLQLGTKSGSLSNSILSSVSTNDAMSPPTPPTSSNHGSTGIAGTGRSSRSRSNSSPVGSSTAGVGSVSSAPAVTGPSSNTPSNAAEDVPDKI